MTGQPSWRSLRSVMLVTAHVAAVAYVVRWTGLASSRMGSLFWVPATITVAVFLSWPIGRAIASAFDPGDLDFDRICPKCGRPEIRPLVRPGAGLFEPTAGFRCAACWTTFRVEGSTRVEVPGPVVGEPVDSTGIAYLSDPLGEDDIRFLDEPPGQNSRSEKV